MWTRNCWIWDWNRRHWCYGHCGNPVCRLYLPRLWSGRCLLLCWDRHLGPWVFRHRLFPPIPALPSAPVASWWCSQLQWKCIWRSNGMLLGYALCRKESLWRVPSLCRLSTKLPSTATALAIFSTVGASPSGPRGAVWVTGLSTILSVRKPILPIAQESRYSCLLPLFGHHLMFPPSLTLLVLINDLPWRKTNRTLELIGT